MKRVMLSAATALVTLVATMTTSSCTQDEITPDPQVRLTEVLSGETELTFLVELENADECKYMYCEGGEIQADADLIMKDGIALDKAQSGKVTIDALNPSTTYTIIAAAKGKVKTVVSEPLVMTTSASSQDGTSVTVTAGEAKDTELSFTVIPSNAVKCSWICVLKSETVPAADEIFSKGTALEKMEPTFVTADGLETATEYMIVAAVEGEDGKSAVSKPVYMTTTDPQAGSDMEVFIKDVTATYNSITFTVVPKNAGGAVYDYDLKTDGYEYRDATDVWFKGKKLESASQESTITIDDLRDDQEYVIYAVVESASSYDRVLTYVDVRTEKRPEPEELPMQTMTEGELTYVLHGNQYVINLSNDAYQVRLDMNEDVDNSEFLTHITPHEYVYKPEDSRGDSFVVTALSDITSKTDGSKLKIVKGSLTVDYQAPEYTITGRLVTDDNKAFNFEYKGQLSFPLDAASGKITLAEGDNRFFLDCEEHTLDLSFGANQIVGDHKVGETLSTESVLAVAKEGGASWKLTDGSLSISSPDEGYYNFKGEFTLDNGDIMRMEQERLFITEPVDPGEQEIVFDEVSARGGPDMTGWLSAYDITLKNAEWEFYIAFETSGDYDELPTGKLIYTSWGGGEISAYRISSKTSGSINDIDEGYMNVTKDGDNYTVEVNFTRTSGEVLKGTYTGPIECMDMSGMM